MCVSEEQKKIPHGNYTYVGLDIDTTGRRLIDEIVQIAAHTPDQEFSQYIMPLMNLNPAARQRHQIRVITVGFFRMLKSMQTYKVIKTKTEIATLNEFLDWLEKMNTKDGVIIIYHDARKFVPYILIEAFKKYNLMDRFLKTVKSFINGYTMAEEKCANTIKYLSLHQLSTLLLNKTEDTDNTDKSDNASSPTTQPSSSGGHIKSHNNRDEIFEGNAAIRAKLAYEIAEHLSFEEQTDLSPEDAAEKMNSFICNKALPVDTELNELKEQEENLVRQNSLRSVFLQYFRSTLYHRVKAVNYRRLLAEFKHDNDSLNELWTNGKRDAIVEAVTQITDLKQEERDELIEILDSHYDPEKKSLKPVVKRSNSRRRMPRNRSNRYNNNGKENRPRRKSRSMDNGHRRNGGNYYNNNNNNNMNYNNNNNNNNMDHKMHMKKEMAHQHHHQQQQHNHQQVLTSN